MTTDRIHRLRELLEFCHKTKLRIADFQVSDIRYLFKLLDDNMAVNCTDTLLQIKKDGVVYKFKPGKEIDLNEMGIDRKWET